MSETKPKGIEVGPAIYVESLMTDQEIKHYSKIYKTYCTSCPKPGATSQESYRWRAGMGKSLTATEIINVNKNIEYLKNYNHAVLQ